jgi:hypothetical protein
MSTPSASLLDAASKLREKISRPNPSPLDIQEARQMVASLTDMLEQNPDGDGKKGLEVQLQLVLMELRRGLRYATGGKALRKASSAGSAEARDVLLRTRGIMSGEIDKVQDSMRKLCDGSDVLRAVHRELETCDAALLRTGNLVGQVKAAQVLDDHILRVSIVVFILSCIYVMATRLGIISPSCITV